MKKVLLLTLFLLIFFPSKTFAQSDYVLPYPSAMPGSKFYAIELVKDAMLKYWYFGSFGQFTYNLKQSDKYLVEAKTLFEYKQYLLGYSALQKSDNYFKKLPALLGKAQKENKNISVKKMELQDASLKHIEVLHFLQKELPENFIWRPEKSSPKELNLKQKIEESIQTREKLL